MSASTVGRPLRVVQWATGNVGRHAVAAMVDHPELEVVGGLVYAADKHGRDLGDICGIGPVGITATTDRDAIVALDADCVLYMAAPSTLPPDPPVTEHR